MAFNPAATEAAYSAQLLAASQAQPAIPVKTEPPSAIPVAVTSVNSVNAGDLNTGSDTTRFLNASGPLLTPGTLAGFSQHEAAFRAAMVQGTLPFPAIYPALHPAEMKPEMMGAARAVPGFFFDPLPYHPYARGLDGTRRKNATRETTASLKAWLNHHRKNPYPTKAEKLMLALSTNMSLTQVSTWFANARRRLKKENKMTWSPRNRPGEDDDDDDLADINATPERNHSDRPSSSTSDADITVTITDPNQKNSSEDVHSKSATPPPCSDTDGNSSRLLPSMAPSPKKTKIWSIAETLSNHATETNSSKEDRDWASTSVGDPKSSDDGRESIPPMDMAGTGPSMITTGHPPLIQQANAPAILTVNGQIPQHFLHFNPWHQQQLAMAIAARMPFSRPELMAVMAQTGHLRPPMLYGPMFMGTEIPGVPQPQQLSPAPQVFNAAAAVSCSPTISQPNGPISHWRTTKSAASVVPSTLISPSLTITTTATTSNGTTTLSMSNSCERNSSNESNEKMRENLSF